MIVIIDGIDWTPATARRFPRATRAMIGFSCSANSRTPVVSSSCSASMSSGA